MGLEFRKSLWSWGKLLCATCIKKLIKIFCMADKKKKNRVYVSEAVALTLDSLVLYEQVTSENEQ